MTAADRFHPVGYRARAVPAVAAAGGTKYIGRHRRPGRRSFSLVRMLYFARHSRRR